MNLYCFSTAYNGSVLVFANSKKEAKTIVMKDSGKSMYIPKNLNANQLQKIEIKHGKIIDLMEDF